MKSTFQTASWKEDLYMKKQRYTAEFKKEAAKMIIIAGIIAKEASDLLGVPAGVLCT